MKLLKAKPPAIDPRDVGWVPYAVECPWCWQRFQTEDALRSHKHDSHSPRGRIIPDRLWSDG